jgi:hypothetical protein
MLLEKLPLELVQHIIGLVISENQRNEQSKALTALFSVNKALGSEVSSLCVRNVQDAGHGLSWWPRVPFPVRFRMAQEIVTTDPAAGDKRTIATYMHAVAYYLQQYARIQDPEETGRLSHVQWLLEIASVLALRGADCACGRPAFVHARCYDLSSVPDTAFHVVVLRQHRKLEAMMILEEGKGIDSICPYLKVSKKDPLFMRRNALEWACAHGLESSVVRLIAVAEEQGRNVESYLPTAAAICALHTKAGKGSLLDFLLNELDKVVRNPTSWYTKLQYRGRIVSFEEWISKVLTSLSQHKILEGISVLHKHYPYFESVFRAVLKEAHWEATKDFMETERPYCILRSWSEAHNCRHWQSCRKDLCRNRFNKTGPWYDVCKGHYSMYCKCEKQHLPDDALYDREGWPTDTDGR